MKKAIITLITLLILSSHTFSQEVIPSDSIYTIVDEKPTFIGGDGAMY